MDEYIDLRDQAFSFFGSGSKVVGNFTLKGVTNISGEIEGNVEMIDESKLVINYLGKITGKITGKDIEIHGAFDGEIISTGHVKALPTATITGSVKAKDLIIYPGAKVNIEGTTEQES